MNTEDPMQYSTDLEALHAHEWLLERSERELEIRRRHFERLAEDAADEPVEHRRRHGFHVPRLALR
ncbi:hypothetical protein ACDF64_05390 [Agromyces sp. MMS24-JH15]|uniref:hypothetical protein n=1 Tax=Agromyces sp. MMS24-JH15 TaxID=3243765 RepID=UPI0037498D04